VVLKGENLAQVKSVFISTKELVFTVKNGELALSIPLGFETGNKDLILKSETASVTVKDAIVVAAAPAPIAKPVIVTSVTFTKVGSKVTIYVTSTKPVSISLGKKIVAKNLVGVRVRAIVTLPRGKSTVSARASGKVVRTATYLVTR
jgi:hypothetical protein